jgi:predicted RNase H-like HicB family nuclease
MMNLTIEIEQEEDGRWIAEAPDLPGRIAKHTGLRPEDL